jgi:hypothetical protein
LARYSAGVRRFPDRAALGEPSSFEGRHPSTVPADHEKRSAFESLLAPIWIETVGPLALGLRFDPDEVAVRESA